MLEKMMHVALLYDFYGQLLTDRQRELVELYYLNDLSLGEIAEDQGISRQAVHDQLRRAGEALEGYEAKLGLVARHLEQQRILQELQGCLERGDLDRARELVQSLVND